MLNREEAPQTASWIPLINKSRSQNGELDAASPHTAQTLELTSSNAGQVVINKFYKVWRKKACAKQAAADLLFAVASHT